MDFVSRENGLSGFKIDLITSGLRYFLGPGEWFVHFWADLD
jgi:hypothetical protein